MPALRSTLALVLALSLAAAGCRRAADTGAAVVRDDFGDTLRLAAPPRRIASLNPASTRLVFALGAGARLVGRTHWDTSPDSVRLVPDLGPGLRPNVEAVLARRPDLVLLYASEDNRAAAAAFHAAGVATLALRIDRIEDFRRAVRLMGAVLDDSARARVLDDTVAATLARVRAATDSLPHPRVFWHAWTAPVITIGRGSFLDELVTIAGGRNVYGDVDAPSPQVSLEDVVRRDPDLVLAFPTAAAEIRADPTWRAVRAVREGHVVAVDTTLADRPSPRMGEAAVALARLLHPGLELR